MQLSFQLVFQFVPQNFRSNLNLFKQKRREISLAAFHKSPAQLELQSLN